MRAQEEHASRRDQTYNAIIGTYRVMMRRMSEMLSEQGLTQPQFHALRIAARRGNVCMREISDEMLVTPPTITGIIDRLEARGLLRRTGRRGDRRATEIELTQRGRVLQERVAKRYNDFVQRALGVFTREEQATLGELLTKLQEGMSDASGEGPGAREVAPGATA